MENAQTVDGAMKNIEETFQFSWPLFAAQMVNILALVALLVLFIHTVRVILRHGRGWEIPLGILLALFFPLLGPLLILHHFKDVRRLQRN